MMDETKTTIINELRHTNCVSSEIQKKYFSGWGFGKIRQWLEDNGLDRHMTIELNSTEVCLLTPHGVCMQVRTTDHNKLGMWGGCLNSDEYHGDENPPKEGAFRELLEELGKDALSGADDELLVSEDDLEFIEWNDHDHEYANGDKARFHCARFRMVIDFCLVAPNIDEETSGIGYVSHTILSHQQEFISRMLGE